MEIPILEVLKIITKIFYETRPLNGVLVVSSDSAYPGMKDVKSIAIPADHISIAKPGKNDLVYLSTKKFCAEVFASTKEIKTFGNISENFVENKFKKVSDKRESEKGELFRFEVVTVNNSGKVINCRPESARQKIEDLGNGMKLEMVYIPGDAFTMGSPESEKDSEKSERPQHDMTVPPFFMGKYPITQGQWKAIASRTDLKEKADLNPDPSWFKEPYQDIAIPNRF